MAILTEQSSFAATAYMLHGRPEMMPERQPAESTACASSPLSTSAPLRLRSQCGALAPSVSRRLSLRSYLPTLCWTSRQCCGAARLVAAHSAGARRHALGSVMAQAVRSSGCTSNGRSQRQSALARRPCPLPAQNCTPSWSLWQRQRPSLNHARAFLFVEPQMFNSGRPIENYQR